MTPQAAPHGWDGLLDAGETIVWQGQPSARITFQGADIASVGMGVFFIAFSSFWIAMAHQITSGGKDFFGPIAMIFPLFGLPFFFIGLYNAAGRFVWDAVLRRRTHYTLTSERAFIAVDHPFQGRLLTDYPMTDRSDISLQVGPPDSVWFRSRPKAVGFVMIQDARRVFSLMRNIQKEAS